MFPATGGALYGPASHGWRRLVPPPGGALAPAGSLSGGRQRASGTGRADGGAVGPAGGAGADRGPRFDAPVGPGGYAWWYVDAFSDDGRFGLTIIAFVGSVFSPYYAWRGRRDPEHHCAINVALYGERKRWAMTERGAARLAPFAPMRSRRAEPAGLGRRAVSIFAIDETCAPLAASPRGPVRLDCEGAQCAYVSNSSEPAAIVWRPIAPLRARAASRMERPKLSWQRLGYFDANSRRRAVGSTGSVVGPGRARGLRDGGARVLRSRAAPRPGRCR